jgi:hypothetical protein
MATAGDEFPIKKPKDEEGFGLLVERDKDRFLTARDGDHMMCPFQCDLCHFRNIQKRDPDPENVIQDATMLRCIRRAILDTFWSRETTTVLSNGREMRQMAKKAELVLMAPPTPNLGPYPVEDGQGMGIAVCILMRSLDPGRNEQFVQYNTARKMRAAFSNFWQASIEGQSDAIVQRNTTKLFTTTCPTYGPWFERFMLGMHKRQGDQSYPDKAISIEVMMALMARFEAAWEVAKGREKEEEAVLFPALFSIITFCGGFRGEETPLMELSGTKSRFSESGRHKQKHVVVSLVGRFKNVIGEHRHMLPLVAVTSSGLKPRLWVGRMIEWYGKKGITRGPVFRNSETGMAEKAKVYEFDILLELVAIQRVGGGIISETVDVYESYGVSRSFRRGSNTHATNQGVTEAIINHNNRWSMIERAKGRTPILGMQQHYSDVLLMLSALLKYSSAL